MMLITRERIEQVLGEAVERGQVTVDGAQGIASRLVERGRKQTNDVLNDLEQLLERGRRGSTIAPPMRAAPPRTPRARRASRCRAPAAAPRVRRLRRWRRPIALRRAAAWARAFRSRPSTTSPRPRCRAGSTDLSPAELRKVRDYERRNANRKTVLNAIESKLG